MKMTQELRHLCYDERLRELGLVSLEERKAPGDLLVALQFLIGPYGQGFELPGLVGGVPARGVGDLQGPFPPKRSFGSTPPRPFSPAAGVPVADVFLLRPPVLGEPNTLVCMVGNVFPPAVEIAWQLDGIPVTQGVTDTQYTPTDDLAFVRFSYLEVTPTTGDIYTCIVTREGDNASVIAYWVPQNPVPTEELGTALCGAAMALGGLLALLGIAMVLLARRSARG
ncbi:LOW QUALITY PROTEIN: class II histocompatibility antigen, M alpha chain [Opisthocomus hoazin]|uniref:LOW QUALITY PROTEIN: class II histocompatibility antigen, M alpha chain n=1 Tax=Opisthocomus hoazin TaxID=30419 RepID=UPI003F52E0A2